LSYSILKNAKFIPEELQLLTEIGKLKERINSSSDDAQKRTLKRLLDEMMLKFNLLLEQRKMRR